ncbi:MAG: hypothetical protein HZT39_07255 [Pseudoxanthomonas sp.]|nr:MAG: hypothetical protein HZT39_07255 [Pseudoxanthomonas sp.]
MCLASLLFVHSLMLGQQLVAHLRHALTLWRSGKLEGDVVKLLAVAG